MALYRKKPIIVDAVQAKEGEVSLLPGVVREMSLGKWIIKTLEGPLEVKPGDWVITGVHGEHYPIKADIFAETYEMVPDNKEADMDEYASTKDPWEGRSKKMRCASCMYYARKSTIPKQFIGRCRRHAPTMSGFPVVFENEDWCGDHKLNEESL